jgi:hypothetical protein
MHMGDERKISTDALDSVTAKLHEFAEGLEPEERTALDMVLAKASAEDEAEVSGFNFASVGSLNLGTRSFDLSRTQTNLRSSLLGSFADSGGGFWELILDGGDDKLRSF